MATTGTRILIALQIVGRVDRLGRGRRLAEAVVPDLVHRDEADLGDLLAHVGAELAVHRLPDALRNPGRQSLSPLIEAAGTRVDRIRPDKREELDAA